MIPFKYPELAFLAKSARKQHNIVHGHTGYSHGDPGHPCIISHCSCITTKDFTHTEVDESKPCDCGARLHNALVDKAVKTLQDKLNK